MQTNKQRDEYNRKTEEQKRYVQNMNALNELNITVHYIDNDENATF